MSNNFKEKDMHPLLVKYIKEDTNFKAFSKTINHSSTKNKWEHPNIIAVKKNFYYSNTLRNFINDNTTETPEIFSFQLNLKLDLMNLREYYFQAVSNSSWANEGYLVTMEIDSFKKHIILEELKRLHSSFGIGVIVLNKDDLQDSKILFRSKKREEIDIEYLKKMLEVNANQDFVDFFEAIDTQIKSAKQETEINKDSFDKVLSNSHMNAYLNKFFGEKVHPMQQIINQEQAKSAANKKELNKHILNENQYNIFEVFNLSLGTKFKFKNQIINNETQVETYIEILNILAKLNIKIFMISVAKNGLTKFYDSDKPSARKDIQGIEINVAKNKDEKQRLLNKVLEDFGFKKKRTTIQTYDRKYWENKIGMDNIELFNSLLTKLPPFIIKDYDLNYNKNYIGLKKNNKATNFISFDPRKNDIVLSFTLKESEEINKVLNDSDFTILGYMKGFNRYRVAISKEDLDKDFTIINTLIQKAHI